MSYTHIAGDLYEFTTANSAIGSKLRTSIRLSFISKFTLCTPSYGDPEITVVYVASERHGIPLTIKYETFQELMRSYIDQEQKDNKETRVRITGTSANCGPK